MDLPTIRLYKLRGRDVWNADTRHADGRRWQFSTREKDEAAARAFAEAKVSGESSSGTAEPGPAVPARERKSWGDRLGGPAVDGAMPGPEGGAADESHDATEDAEGVEPTEDAELVADVLSMAGTVGFQEAIGRTIRRQTWREGKRVGHYEPGPPNERCALGFQAKLRDRLLVLFGRVSMGPWVGLGLYGIGIAVTMKMASERVEDVQPEKKQTPEHAPADERTNHHATPAPRAEAAGDPEDFRRQLAARS